MIAEVEAADLENLSEEKKAEYIAALDQGYNRAHWDHFRATHRPGIEGFFPDGMRRVWGCFEKLEGDIGVVALHDLSFVRKSKEALDFAGAYLILREISLRMLTPASAWWPDVMRSAAESERIKGSWDLAEQMLLEVVAELDARPEVYGEEAHGTRLGVLADHAQIHILRGEWDLARAKLAVFWSYAETHPRPWAIERGYAVEMQLYFQLHRYEDALALGARIRADVRVSPDGEVPIDLRASLALAHANLARFGDDQESQSNSVQRLCEVLELEGLSGTRALWLRLRKAELLQMQGKGSESLEEIGVIRALVPSFAEMQDPYHVLLSVEARALLDAQAGPQELTRLMGDFDSAWTRLLAEWGALELRDEGIGRLWISDLREMLALRITLQLKLLGNAGGARAALSDYLQMQSLGSLARTLGVPTPSVSDVEAGLLPDGHGIVVLVPGRTRLVELHLDQGGAGGLVVPVAESKYNELIAELGGAIELARVGAKNQERLDQLRAELSEKFFSPSLQAVMEDWRSVSLVGTEWLDFVPYGYLPALDGDPIGCQIAVSLLPSIPVGLALAGRKHQAFEHPASISVFACPAPGIGHAGVVDIPPEDRHLRLLEPASASIEVRSWLGDEVSEANIGEAELGLDRAVHLLLHGIADSSQPDRAAFALPGGKQLTLPFVERLSLPPIALISACGANRAPIRKGDDGRNNLVGALQIAGVRSALVPHVEVGYVPSLHLTREVLDRASLGAPMDIALQGALSHFHSEELEGVHESEYFLPQLYGLPGQILAQPGEVERKAPPHIVGMWGGAALFVLVGSLLWIIARRGRARV